MSFELPEYKVLSDKELRSASRGVGIEYARTGSAIVWLSECVMKIRDHLSEMDDDVDALWAVACDDVPSPAEFASEDGAPRFATSGFKTEAHNFCDTVWKPNPWDNFVRKPEAETPAAKVIHTFPEGEKATGSNAFHINGKDRVFFSTNLNIYELIDCKLHKVLLANA